MTRSSRSGSVESAEAHWVEWLAGGVSALLVAALLGWLAWDALQYRQDPPAFTVDVVSVTPESGGWRVAFEVRNTASTAAAGVEVRGTLSGGESADVTFDYVAARSGEKGALFFRGDPRAGGLALAVAGYADP
ncbi:TIGR02588 family protein [Shinella pollutisoli]|uniref:TIGR02588 family protein n=1 Tax=Shinella pollutisoli TaxID=2250594 RepID=A0ABV7DH94_9HYPH|nr:TIGR02588 family protein [Shinella pollutisoli]